MTLFNLYPGAPVREGKFLRRLNRFVMRLRIGGEAIDCVAANTGRMEEFLIPGAPFHVIPSPGKYPWRVIATRYRDKIILLDTIRYNRLAAELLRQGMIPGIARPVTLKREVPAGNSRLDFMVHTPEARYLLEVKSCSLGHRKIVMFPDAPTERGRRHLQELEEQSGQPGLECRVLFLTTHADSRWFLPNYHTDLEYARTLYSLRRTGVLACRIAMADPVTVDLDSLQGLDFPNPGRLPVPDNGGVYCLVLVNPKPAEIKVGALGAVAFPAGYYLYCGSARRGMAERLRRHRRRRKTRRWHIDSLTSGLMSILKVYPVRTHRSIERLMARRLADIADSVVPDFGAGDSPEGSHLSYFRSNPIPTRAFQNLILDFRHHLESGKKIPGDI